MMLEALKLIKILFIWSAMLYVGFICCKLNGVNVIVLLLEFVEIFCININIYVMDFGVNVDVNFDINNVVWFKNLMNSYCVN